MTNFECSNEPHPTKKPQKEKTKAWKIEKFLIKLVVGKDKGFDSTEC